MAERHGDPGFYRHCRAGGFGACDDCKAAQAARMRSRRASQKALREAQEKARHRLAGTYPEVFAALVDIELGRQVAA